MVRKEVKGDKNHFRCEICDFYYLKESLAKKCEEFCKENNSCNLDIVQYAVNFTKGE